MPADSARWQPDSGALGMDKESGNFGLIVGSLFAMAAVILIFSGGEFSGKKTIGGDQDLPPIATPNPN